MHYLRLLVAMIFFLVAGCAADNGGYYRGNNPYASYSRSSYRDDEPAYHDDGDETVLCESTNQHHKTCHVSLGRHDRVYLIDRVSNSNCYEGRDWGWDRGSIWVDNGCRAKFRIDRR